MTKIEKTLKDYDNAVEAKASLEGEIAKLKQDQARLAEEADQAAEDGNLALYRQKKKAISDLDDEILIREKRLRKTSCQIDEKEVLAAWSEYAKEHDRQFEKEWTAFEKLRKDLFSAYMAIVMKQNDALKIRERLGTAIGLADMDAIKGKFAMKTIPEDRGNRCGNFQLRSLDTDYFFSAGLAKEERDLTPLNSIVRLKISV